MLINLSTATSGASEALTAGLQNAQGEILGIIAIVVPMVMVVVGAILAIRFGIRFFKSLAKG